MIFSEQTIAPRAILTNAGGVPQDADSLPTAVLYVDGVADDAVVTVTKVDTGTYLWSLTLPTLTVGQLIQVEASFVHDGLDKKLTVFEATCDSSSTAIDWTPVSGSGVYALTFSEMYQALYDILGLTAETTMVKRMINEALAEIVGAKRWSWKRTQSTVSHPGGTYLTAAPDDCYEILGILDSSENRLEYVETRTFDELFRADKTTTGTPQIYTVQNANSSCVPMYRLWPWQTVTGNIIIRYYRKVPALVLAADVAMIPSELHFLIVKGAEARFRQWENNELAPQTRAEFDAILARFVAADGGSEE